MGLPLRAETALVNRPQATYRFAAVSRNRGEPQHIMSAPDRAGTAPPYTPATLGPVVDWEAYSRLLNYVREAKSPFFRAASEYGLTRLLAPGSLVRQASGSQLADDLFRDGKRIQQRFSARYFPVADLDSLDAIHLDAWSIEVDEAIATIQTAFSSLRPRSRAALALNARGDVEEAEVRRLLGVGLRRYRDIVRESRRALLTHANTLEAYRTILDGIGGNRHDRIAELIEEIISDEVKGEGVNS